VEAVFQLTELCTTRSLTGLIHRKNKKNSRLAVRKVLFQQEVNEESDDEHRGSQDTGKQYTA
jgi:hypothetical protein